MGYANAFIDLAIAFVIWAFAFIDLAIAIIVILAWMQHIFDLFPNLSPFRREALNLTPQR
ncbi:hypothetical protein [Nostoc sp.]|uniref:hypothetical protein n=1 Tax=Nostoc sp. TaxID=1180 RepID=UPI002FFBD4AB